MAANRTFSAQMALDTCTEHAHEEIDMYCKTCEKYICSKCVKDEHKDHDWNTLKKIAKELRNETVNRMSALVSVSESILAGTTEVLKTLSSQTEDELSRNCSRLESTRGALIDFVNDKINEMKVECEKNHESKMLIVRERKKDLETKSNRVKFLKKSIQAEARHYTDFDVIELHNELRILLCEVQSLSIIPQILNEEIVYQSVLSSTGTELLTRLMGSLEVKQSTDTMTIEREFQLNTEINSICPISQNEAWMHVGKTTINKLVDAVGDTMSSLDLRSRVYNFTVSEDGITYFCDTLDSRSVRAVDKNGELRTMFTTFPLIPRYINITGSGDLLISLVDEISNERTSSSRRLLRRMTLAGDILKEYEFTNDGKTPLFNIPAKAIELFNGRICVLDVCKSEDKGISGTVYGFDIEDSVIFSYRGMDGRFNPLDICCDRKGNTLVSDSVNRRIHMIDREGEFVRYILTKESLSVDIYPIAIFGNRLWVGSKHKGLIKVYKFE